MNVPVVATPVDPAPAAPGSPHTPVWLLVGLTVLIVVATTVLIMASHAHDVPSWFQDLAFVSVGGAGGVAVPRLLNQQP